jgi:hypothetical protein
MKLIATQLAVSVLDVAGTRRSLEPSKAMPCMCRNCHLKQLSSLRPSLTAKLHGHPTPGHSL